MSSDKFEVEVTIKKPENIIILIKVYIAKIFIDIAMLFLKIATAISKIDFSYTSTTETDNDN
jgi:hypothetical protein